MGFPVCLTHKLAPCFCVGGVAAVQCVSFAVLVSVGVVVFRGFFVVFSPQFLLFRSVLSCVIVLVARTFSQ